MTAYSYKFLIASDIGQLEDIRDEKADELIQLQRKKYCLIAQIEHLQHLVDKEEQYEV